MKTTALIYSENEFGKTDGKVANGLVRHSDKYHIVGVIDSTVAGQDAGEYLDRIINGIPIYESIKEAIDKSSYIPEYFIYGIAPSEIFLNKKQREVITTAMKTGMNIVNGLPEFFTDDPVFVQMANKYSVDIYDIRKPPPRQDLHHFTGLIHAIETPVVAVLGTDCAVGKRTTSVSLVEALKQEGLNAVFIATGQTGLLQGSKYGIAVDVLSSGFATGEVENAIVQACESEHPDIIVVEGQGSLSNPSYTSTCAIIKGARPDAIIVQHAPKRIGHCSYPNIPIPTLESEIKLLEAFSKSKVIAITVNHEDMTDFELENFIVNYENAYNLPATDVLKHGCGKLIKKLLDQFPELQKLANSYMSDCGEAAA